MTGVVNQEKFQPKFGGLGGSDFSLFSDPLHIAADEVLKKFLQ